MRARLLAVMAILASACGDDPPQSFPTYQECFDDRTMAAAMLVPDAIVACCLEHPIGGMTAVCGATAPDCINYLTANLAQTSASTIEVMDSCTEYVMQKKTTPE